MANHGATPMSIISPQYCTPHPLELAVTRKLLTITEDGNFAVSDVNNGNILFKVKGAMFSLHDKHVLLDGAGNPIVTLRHKLLSAHGRWEVYRGDSHRDADILFTVKNSSVIQFHTSLDVFLASNTKEEVCDFKIKGSWHERSCAVYHGETSNIAAQMHKKHSHAHHIVHGEDKFMVTVSPHVDYAFIVALIVILGEIDQDTSGTD